MKYLTVQNLVLPESDFDLVEEIYNNWKEIADECVEKNYLLDLTNEEMLILDGCSDLKFVRKIENFILGGSHGRILRGKKIIGYLIK